MLRARKVPLLEGQILELLAQVGRWRGRDLWGTVQGLCQWYGKALF